MDAVETRNKRKDWYKWLVFAAAGLVFLGWLLNTPPGLLGKADAIGYAVCHRIDARSFHIGDRALPLCARCSGMYLGAVLGLVYQFSLFPHRSGRPRWFVLVFMVLTVGAFGVDGVNSYLHLFKNAPSLYEPNNVFRLITGTGMGLTMALGIYLAFNQTVWADWDERPSISGWKPFIGLLAAAAVVDLLALSNLSFILYPLAVISALGVIGLLTMLYTMLVALIFRKENRYHRLSEMILPITGGFIVALLQIAAFDFVRYLLTGTWDGFHIG